MDIRSLLTLTLLFAGSAPLRAADWVVARVSQPSKFTTDNKTWSTLKAGMTVPNQSWISTGPRGRVVLQRNKDQVTFQPGTMAGVFERAGMAVHTDFAQQTGTLSLSIDPQVKPHLSVQTPYLAAVVKGTVFSVSITKNGATVGVDRGRVEVTDPRSGEKTGVSAGQQASVDQDPSTPMSLGGVNENFEAVVKVRPFAPAVPAATAAADDGHVSSKSAANGAANASEHGRADRGEAGKNNSEGRSSNGSDNAGSSGREGASEAGDRGSAGAGNGNGNSGENGNGNGNGNSSGNQGANGQGNGQGGGSGNGQSEGRGDNGRGHDD